MDRLKQAMRWLDRMVEWLGAYLMLIMVVIVFWQVFSRYVLHHTPAWSEEMVLTVMQWFGFISIAAGFRRQMHLRITFIVDRFPKWMQRGIDKAIDLLVILYGLVLTVEGYRFTLLTWSSHLPVTGLPNGLQYLVIPAAGALTMLYGLMHLFSREGKVR
ncbi:MAG: TRAP transporter small permease [Alicyclobacillus macrosporangiidus]|uniref:TRAP transporter small permease n=1 Tax=Alicyclobacillus macrosporangiidus TaxID=392015 RepID=UPI0026E9E0D9|nr:TRAP transporter small permease [Alicyclobacillus macrosporangiidus]MCL6597188.1 TRAP transporter small permease [Alicyclobacillus macrosporangiidus]